MAGTAAMQSILTLTSPLTRVTNRSRVNQLLPATNVSCLPRNANMQVRCMSQNKDYKDQEKTSPPRPQLIPTPPLKVSTKFADVFAFGGPAPERINGRLAMIGFVAAMAVELSNGQELLAQISNGGISWFVGTSIVLSLASLVPLFKGISAESKSEGVLTSDAELWNGRFAMVGLVALAFTEYMKGGSLV